jgi:hypothetical protein
MIEEFSAGAASLFERVSEDWEFVEAAIVVNGLSDLSHYSLTPRQNALIGPL